MQSGLLGEYLLIGVMFGVVVAWDATRFQKKYGQTPWGIPYGVWILIGLTGVIPTAILALIAHKTTKPLPGSPKSPAPTTTARGAAWATQQQSMRPSAQVGVSQFGPPSPGSTMAQATQFFGQPASAQAAAPTHQAAPSTAPVASPQVGLPRFAAGPGAVPPPL